MQHLQTGIEVNAWGLTQIEMESVLSLQENLGGTGVAFDYAYEVITGVLPLGSYNEKTSYKVKRPGGKRATINNEADLARHYRMPPHLCNTEYLQQRWKYGLK